MAGPIDAPTGGWSERAVARGEPLRPPGDAIRPVEAEGGPEGVDAIQALSDLGEEQAPPDGASLAEQLLAWMAPHPRRPETLSQSRIVPLLGLAADLLSHAAEGSDDIVQLGSTALEQELRMQRALAERRATLVQG